MAIFCIRATASIPELNAQPGDEILIDPGHTPPICVLREFGPEAGEIIARNLYRCNLRGQDVRQALKSLQSSTTPITKRSRKAPDVSGKKPPKKQVKRGRR